MKRNLAAAARGTQTKDNEMRVHACRISFIACLIAAVGVSQGADAASQKLPCADGSRECLAATATAYIDALASHDGASLPLTPNVRRTENGLVNAQGENEVRESFKDTRMVWGRRNQGRE